MKAFFLRTIMVLGISIFYCGCKKDDSSSNNNNNNGNHSKHCYPSVITIKNGGGATSTESFFYDNNWATTKIEVQEGGASLQTDVISWSGNQVRTDIYYSTTSGQLGYHAQYTIIYLNADSLADSLTSFSCIDCNLQEPVNFKRDYVTTFHRSGGKLVGSESWDAANSKTTESFFEYDSKGRAISSLSFDEYGDTSAYVQNIYPANEKDIYKTEQSVAPYKYLFGDGLVYQPQRSIIYYPTYPNGITVDWEIKGNADGYLESATGTSGGQPYQKTTYAYTCAN